MVPITAEELQRMEDLYYTQSYAEGEVIEMDDSSVPLDFEDGQMGNSTEQIEGQIRNFGRTLKRLDFFQLIFSWLRIEAQLTPETYLVDLRLSSCKIMPLECLSLARSPHLTFLKSLDLSCNPIKLHGLLYLLDQKESKLSHLKRLDLYYCSINGS